MIFFITGRIGSGVHTFTKKLQNADYHDVLNELITLDGHLITTFSDNKPSYAVVTPDQIAKILNAFPNELFHIIHMQHDDDNKTRRDYYIMEHENSDNAASMFDKLDAELAKAILSIGAIKGIEFGSGFESAKMTGSTWNDNMSMKDGNVNFLSNHAGGILGGISNGNEIIFRDAVKPVPSIFKQQQTIDIFEKETEILIEGRHDICLCPRIIPVVESMTAITLLDLYLQNKISNINNFSEIGK